MTLRKTLNYERLREGVKRACDAILEIVDAIASEGQVDENELKRRIKKLKQDNSKNAEY